MSLNNLPNNCEDVAAEQGWNEDTLVTLLSEFITEQGLEAELLTFLEGKADEENDGADDGGWDEDDDQD